MALWNCTGGEFERKLSIIAAEFGAVVTRGNDFHCQVRPKSGDYFCFNFWRRKKGGVKYNIRNNEKAEFCETELETILVLRKALSEHTSPPQKENRKKHKDSKSRHLQIDQGVESVSLDRVDFLDIGIRLEVDSKNDSLVSVQGLSEDGKTSTELFSLDPFRVEVFANTLLRVSKSYEPPF